MKHIDKQQNLDYVDLPVVSVLFYSVFLFFTSGHWRQRIDCIILVGWVLDFVVVIVLDFVVVIVLDFVVVIVLDYVVVVKVFRSCCLDLLESRDFIWVELTFSAWPFAFENLKLKGNLKCSKTCSWYFHSRNFGELIQNFKSEKTMYYNVLQCITM